MLAIAVHGGAGTLPRAELTTAKRQAFRAGLEAALRAGYAHLERRSSSLDAVVAAVRVLEDDPLFNAGRGAVYAANGTIELDASLMDGATLRAGAVAGVRHVRSPIELARRVLEHSPHVMLAGQGAEEFALYAGHVVVVCRTPRGEAELAMSPSSLTGLQSWLEAGPPGSRPSR